MATGKISVSGNRILRDGVPWVPHGLQLVAFVAAPAVRSDADKVPFNAAYQYYSQHSANDGFSELKDIKGSVRPTWQVGQWAGSGN